MLSCTGIMSDWGIYSLEKESFVSKFSDHASRYTGPPIRGSKTEVESWLDAPGQYHGQSVEVRPDPPAWLPEPLPQ